jgi:nitroreductase
MTSSKPATTDYPINPLLIERWSPRAFSADLLLPEEILSLFEAARWAPSGGNGQPWSFIVAPHSEEELFERLVGCLSEGNVPWARQAPLLILTIARVVRDNGAAYPGALYDLGLAAALLTVQATSLGLHVHQMAGFSKEQASEVFAIPEGYQPVTVLAIGRYGSLEELPERFRDREVAPRSRKPLSEFVFGSTWGEVSPLLESRVAES